MDEFHEGIKPPRIARSFLLWFIKPELAEEVEGDLYEKYVRKFRSTSHFKARVEYWYQVFNYLRPFAIRHFGVIPKINVGMLRNYFKISFRNLLKHKGYSIINIFGLTVSLTVVLLMLLWVRHEWSMDKFHEEDANLYRVKRTIPLENNTLDVYAGISYPMIKAAADEIPAVKGWIPIGYPFQDNLQWNEQVIRASGTFGNADYFKAFSFPVLKGDVDRLDQSQNAIVISRQLAINMFGQEWQDALGKTIHIHDNGDFIVEAIYEDMPDNSSLQSQFIYSFGAHLAVNDWLLEWTNNGMQGVIWLEDNADPTQVRETLEEMFHSHQEGDRKEGCFLQPFSDNYLYSNFNDQGEVSGGRIEYVRIFLIAAILLLIISCINFVNLATARATERAKEVGVRKTIGAQRKSLITQFLVESFLVTGLSLGLGIFLGWLLVPYLNILTGKSLVIPFGDPLFWAGLLSILIVTSLMAGSYPALILSSFKPISILKGRMADRRGEASFRKALVVFQFSLALLLITGALVIRNQVNYIQNAHLGIARDNLLMIHQDEAISQKLEVLEDKITQDPSILGFTVAGPFPHNMQASTSGVQWPGKRPDQENVEVSILWTASSFPEVFDIPLVAGSYYREKTGIDTMHVVLNETAADLMLLGDDPVGKVITWWGKPREVIGVLKDFHNRSFYEKIEPSGFLFEPANAGNVFIKVKSGEMKEAIAAVEEAFAEVVPDVPLAFDFVDEEYRSMYTSEVLTGKLANYFAVISIIISSLGLFGLITFIAKKKTREIGIRKILGASVSSLMQLMSRQFVQLVLLALLIAIPISYFILQKWLDRFAYTVEVNWWMIFGSTAVLGILFTFLSIGYQSLKAATHSPVDSLRSE